jgi:hypothetical protein
VGSKEATKEIRMKTSHVSLGLYARLSPVLALCLVGCTAAVDSKAPEPGGSTSAPDIFSHCQSVLSCGGYNSFGTEVYQGDIEIKPYTATSCATAMVTATIQRPGELFLPAEFTTDHQVLDHEAGRPVAPVGMWSGDEKILTFDWTGYSFTCAATDPSGLSCQPSGHVCVNKNLCCSGVCAAKATGTGAVCL